PHTLPGQVSAFRAPEQSRPQLPPIPMPHPMRVLAFLLVAAVAVPAVAQPDASASEVGETNTAYYSFLRTGEVPIEVFVLGEVRAPGVYAVGLGTDLDHLLALAGGMAYSSTEEGIERNVIVRLYHAP